MNHPVGNNSTPNRPTQDADAVEAWLTSVGVEPARGEDGHWANGHREGNEGLVHDHGGLDGDRHGGHADHLGEEEEDHHHHHYGDH